MTKDEPPLLGAWLKRWSSKNVPPERRLNFALIREDVDVLLESFAEKVDRQWPEALSHLPGLQVYTKGTVPAARAAYGAVRQLCSERKCWRPAPLAVRHGDAAYCSHHHGQRLHNGVHIRAPGGEVSRLRAVA